MTRVTPLVFRVTLILLALEGCSPLFDWRFSRVHVDMSEEAVLDLFGTPDEAGTEFHLSQREAFEAVYESALQSGASRWLFWHRAVDLTYAVGFDAGGRVRFKAVGGT
jgi:hypothetical protein